MKNRKIAVSARKNEARAGRKIRWKGSYTQVVGGGVVTGFGGIVAGLTARTAV